MTELRSQINIRLTADANVSIGITRLIDNETDAEDFGAELNRMVTAWVRGWDRAAHEE